MSDQGVATPAPKGHAFGKTFWMLNSIEAFERLAYFGIRAVVPLYIMQATEPGGLHLTAMHKGTIYAWWALFQSFLPIVTGGIADRYGYKKLLFLAIVLNATGYIMMANFHNYYGFFAGILVLAVGTSFFKPSLQGSLAQNLTKANSSLGWGIFYWVVNVGAFAAPFVSTAILGKPHSLAGWQNLFYTCAAFTGCNLLLLFTFKDVPSGASKSEGLGQVVVRTVKNIFEVRLIIWLLIMSCFWLMMYQLWDLHPNFITDWVDSSEAAKVVPFDSWWEYGDRGQIQVPQQIMLNLNAGLIICFMVPLSWLSGKMRTLSAMMVGMSVAVCGVLVAGLTNNVWFLLLGIVFFSMGEMWTGPKKNEYLGLIAPPGKKGLYLGYVNIPVGIGLFVGSYLAGFVYDNYGEKASLALKELGTDPVRVGQAAQSIDWSDSLEKLPGILDLERAQALSLAQEYLQASARSETAARLRDLFRFDKGQLTNLALLHLARHEDTKDSSVRRSEAWAMVRQLEAGDDRDIADSLWEKYGSDEQVLADLALEYLAQATPLVRDRVAAQSYPNPLASVPEKSGIDRTKSFNALSATAKATEQTLASALAKYGAADDPDGAVYTYLMNRPHRLFAAVTSRDWSFETALLKQIVARDEGAKQAAREQLDGIDDLAALAGDLVAIQAVLAEVDWRGQPHEAAYLLGVNPFEARIMAATDEADAQEKTTKMLWEKYDPQYKVWIPFAIIGVLATIALGIFGQLAKRWKDMNA